MTLDLGNDFLRNTKHKLSKKKNTDQFDSLKLKILLTEMILSTISQKLGEDISSTQNREKINI